MNRLFTLLQDMLLEAIGTILTIALISLTQYLLEAWVGKDKKFFEWVPIEWVFDAGHIAVVLRLAWRVIRKFNDAD